MLKEEQRAREEYERFVAWGKSTGEAESTVRRIGKWVTIAFLPLYILVGLIGLLSALLIALGEGIVYRFCLCKVWILGIDQTVEMEEES